MSGRPIRVAIVGGGCAGVTTAFELTRPEHRGRYEVTVYQVGWRLGGKGASGRGPAGRIEEHGLHLWMGFYENAFRLMRECYAELGRDPRTCPIATWEDAFEPAPLVGVADRGPDGRWQPWFAEIPPTPGLPGDPLPGGVRWTVTEYVGRVVTLLRTLVGSLGASLPEGDGVGPDAVLPRALRLLRYGELATLAALAEAIALLDTMLGSLSSYPENVVLRVLDAFGVNARKQIDARAAEDVELRRLWTIVDLTLATLRGIVRFHLPTDPRGFDAIDDYDCREWLLLNGASEQSVESGYLRGLYDLGFSYEDGDPARPRIAAGQALRSMVRAFFTYRGAFFWRMRAGMGDVVFAPFYEALRRRGVRFAFFHRLENVRLGRGEPPYVDALDFDVQAEVRGDAYEPLVDVGGLPCWPSAPDWTQLVDGEQLRTEGRDFESFWDRRRTRPRTLRVGDDFDLVVLAVGLGAVPHVCRELVARDARWRTMVERVKTVATQAFQVWLAADMAALGWPGPAISVSGFVEPFDTWADMRHLIVREGWTNPPRALAYFCNVLADDDGAAAPDYPARQRERVRRNAVRFLDEDVRHLWPRAATPAGFRWDLLVAPEDGGGGTGAARFASQFWTANVNPSDRYALSLPGTSALRISPLDPTYDNLTVAGDWTSCGFNAGCVEAAVMSGRLAAHAIARAPALEDIVGFDHP
ncbi:MAG TPA: FAD-dependent oxidoreductase [Candidatus Binatia bacterium]|nr:FAD-dependent oxidoreductase [Candidatus Binatia bacterium]